MQNPIKKKIVILWHNGGRLANQLWLFVSLYAYALEKGYELQNHSFFEYNRFFNIQSGNRLIDWVFFKGFNLLKGFFRNPYNLFFRRVYKLYLKTMEKIFAKQMLYAREEDGMAYKYLPPSPHVDAQVLKFENSAAKTFYTDGWLFRNPVGVIKHRDEIIRYFKPKEEIQSSITKFLEPVRARYSHVVGVHIRQGDYKTWQGGKFYFGQNEVAVILREYLEKFNKNPQQTCFVICSDGSVDTQCFEGLNVVKSTLGVAGDLFVLSATDRVIGSSSTFGAFAAFYGKLQFITFQRPGVDWEYYLKTDPGYESKYYSINYLDTTRL